MGTPAIIKPNAIRLAGRLMYVGAVVELIRLNLSTGPPPESDLHLRH